MKWRVLLVDDDHDVLRLLRTAFDEDEFEVRVVSTGQEALDAIAAVVPDLMVLDVHLPDIQGTEIARRIRSVGLTMPILMLTGLASEQQVVAGLDSGATAYVAKPVRKSEVRAWSRALLRTMRTADVRSYAGLELDAERQRLRHAASGKEVSVTPVQVRLMAVLMDAAGEPLSRESLLQRVWDTAFDPGTLLVEVHISHLRRKLAMVGCARQLETVRNVGYKLRQASL